MMVTKTKEVGVRLSVKDKDVAQRAMREFGTEGSGAMHRIENAAKPASVSVLALNSAVNYTKSGLVNFAAGAVGAVAAIFSVRSAIAGTTAALEAFGQIADDAKASGLDTEFFQGVAYQAKMAGVEYGALSSSLQTFVKNAGQAEAGKGRMFAALKALNPELLENIRLATSQEERLRLVADALDRTEGASDKAALAVAIFGDAGTKMVEVFSGGASAMDATIAKARDLGLVIDRDLIARAEELGDEFDTATQIIDLQFKQALINLAPFLVWVAGLAGNLAEGINKIVDAIRPLEEKSAGWLQGKLAEIGSQRVFVEADVLKLRDAANADVAAFDIPGMLDRNAAAGSLANAEAKMAELAAEEEKILGILAGRQTTSAPPLAPNETDPIAPLSAGKPSEIMREAEALMKRLRSSGEEYASTLANLDQMLNSGLITQETYNRAVGEAVLKRVASAQGEEEYAAALATVEAAKAQGIISEQEYSDVVEKMTKKRLESQNDWIAGLQLGLLEISQQGNDIAQDISGVLVNAVGSFEDAFLDMFKTGKFEWKDLASTILSDLAKMALHNATGGVGGFLAGLFKPAGAPLMNAKGNVFQSPSLHAYANQVVSQPTPFMFANGGAFGVMGEADPEAIMPLRRNSRGQLGVMTDGQSGMVFAPVTNISIGEGANVSEAQIKSLLDARDRAWRDQLPNMVKDIGKRPNRTFV